MATNDRESESSIATARFLQARITALSTSLIKRLENLFAASLEEEVKPPLGLGVRPDSGLQDEHDVYPPTLTDTAIKQLQLEVETTGLIRSAEELMVLTRSMKELWLFGGLDTIRDEATTEISENEQFVVANVKHYLVMLNTMRAKNSATALSAAEG